MQMLRVSGRAIAVDLELTWQHLLGEFHPKQTRAVRKWISPFTMGLYGSPYDYVIHVAIRYLGLARTTNLWWPRSALRCRIRSGTAAAPHFVRTMSALFP